MSRALVNPKHAGLIEDWKKVYDDLCAHEFSAECDFENFCWGWCMGKGLTLDEAYDFYQAMIELRVF